MYSQELSGYRFILASKSPRRQHLLKEIGLTYEILEIDVDESYPADLKGSEIARYLCLKKAEAVDFSAFSPGTVVITADTIVWLDGEYIGKPRNREDAKTILRKLSGKTHTVYSGICLLNADDERVFCSETRVTFREITDAEIEHYITHHRPFDKAGAYGIQDWIGYVAVTGIEGCYYNVMGFPVQEFYTNLLDFLSIRR